MLDSEQRIAQVMHPKNDRRCAEVRKSYLICTSPRVGSHMVAYSLEHADLGRPMEYLNPLFVKAYGARLGASPTRFNDYFDFLRHNRSSSTGVFGLKAHFNQVWSNFPNFETLQWFLGLFDQRVFLRRRNKVAQGISHWRALKSGLWFARDASDAIEGRKAAEAFDLSGIAESLSFVVGDDDRWERALAHIRSPHLTVFYEDLLADYPTVMRQICDYIGLSVPQGGFEAPVTQKIGDGLNSDWEDRFVAAIRGLAERR